MSQSMHLVLFSTSAGFHAGGWRFKDAELPHPLDWSFCKRLARKAEQAKLDMLFVADKLAIDDIYGGSFDATVAYRPTGSPEPITLLSALSGVTDKIGLGATVSTTYSEPYTIARMLATMDHLSGGRIAWNVVTSTSDGEARNFGRPEHLSHSVRYSRAAEYIEAVASLWDSWEDDAYVLDKEKGVYADSGKIHYANHSGEWFSIRGPLNVPRPPQGHPVMISAGASATFQQLAAGKAEVIFAVQPGIGQAKAFYRSFKELVEQSGRSRDAVKILPGLMPIIGQTEEEAREKEAMLRGLVQPVGGLSFMSGSMNYDLSRHTLDEPFPDILDQIKGSKGRFKYVIEKAAREGMTVAEVGKWYAASASFHTITGTARQVADEMERWYAEEACDGFVLMPPYMNAGFDDFAEQVIPLLQERGIYRKEYEGSTLREHLGLERPANRHTAGATDISHASHTAGEALPHSVTSQ